MEPSADQPRAPESKPAPKPNAKDNLKSLPLPELQAKLESSPDGLSQAEAQKRLAQYGPNEIACGQWEGKTPEEVNREFHDTYVRWLADPGRNAPTGGERAIDIARRS
jgi:hypothetical protein